ncbi:MAG: hypothetical protein KR126chlam3_00072 [Chlamydiae bacterium]|nr:hypothetical protein [Chlamydiota bacterium]
MNRQFFQLVQDTVMYLRQEGFFLEKSDSVSPSPKQPPPQKPKLKPITKQVEEPITLQKSFLEKKTNSSPLLFDAIQKHLPHIRLIKEIPTQKQVAILISDDEDLPFLKNIARAIQDRLCSVKLLRKENALDLQPFTLVLSQEKIEGISEKKQILLAKGSHYQNNTAEKQNLWSQICQSLKSS